MPLKSGPPRECTFEARCGVAIGPFRNANNGQHLSRPAIHFFVNVAPVRNPIARRICMEVIRPAPACP